jgi:hypothetical protein
MVEWPEVLVLSKDPSTANKKKNFFLYVHMRQKSVNKNNDIVFLLSIFLSLQDKTFSPF